MKQIALLLLLASFSSASNVEWTRFKGKVKATNGKTQSITIQNAEQDLITIKVDLDVQIIKDKEEVNLREVQIDDKVTLLYQPKAPAPKDPDEPEPGGVYAPFRK